MAKKKAKRGRSTSRKRRPSHVRKKRKSNDFPYYLGPTWPRQKFAVKGDPYAQVLREAGQDENFAYDGRDGGILRLAIERLKRSVPKRTKYGQLYARVEQTKKRYKRVSLFALFVSDDGHKLFRRHIFESKRDARDPAEWHAWFSKHLEKVHKEGVLPGMLNRTGGRDFWAVKRLVGYVADYRSSPRTRGKKSAISSKSLRKRQKVAPSKKPSKKQKKRGGNARRKK